MYDELYGTTNAGGDVIESADGSLGTWFRNLLLHPVLPANDYFDRLRGDVEASAPVCSTCG